jgi:hypothetical protein
LFRFSGFLNPAGLLPVVLLGGFYFLDFADEIDKIKISF